eukprot:1530995-Amphidinium_carterae.1
MPRALIKSVTMSAANPKPFKPACKVIDLYIGILLGPRLGLGSGASTEVVIARLRRHALPVALCAFMAALACKSGLLGGSSGMTECVSAAHALASSAPSDSEREWHTLHMEKYHRYHCVGFREWLSSTIATLGLRMLSLRESSLGVLWILVLAAKLSLLWDIQ